MLLAHFLLKEAFVNTGTSFFLTQTQSQSVHFLLSVVDLYLVLLISLYSINMQYMSYVVVTILEVYGFMKV